MTSRTLRLWTKRGMATVMDLCIDCMACLKIEQLKRALEVIKWSMLSFTCNAADTSKGLSQPLQNLIRKINWCRLKMIQRSSRNRRWDTNHQGCGTQTRLHVGFHTEKLDTSHNCLRMCCHHCKNNKRRRLTSLTQHIVRLSNSTDQMQQYILTEKPKKV